jgi:hypothetical protein
MKTTSCCILSLFAAVVFASGPKERFSFEKSPQLGRKIHYDRQLLAWAQFEYPDNLKLTISRHCDAFLVGGEGEFADFSFSIPYEGEELKSTSAELITPQGKVKKVGKENLSHQLAHTFEVYSDRKKAVWSLSNVDVGSIVCIEYTVEHGVFAGCGYAFLQDVRWDLDSTIVEFIPPRGWTVRLTPEAVPPGRVVVDGLNVYAGAMKRWEERPFQGDFGFSAARFSFEILPIGKDRPPKEWSDVSTEWVRRWGELKNGVGTLHYAAEQPLVLDSLFRRFEHDFRYVAIELGEGGVIPHLPKDVLKNRYGDCKDLSFFLCSALKEAGVEIYPVLVRAPWHEPFVAEYPNPFQFNHCITAVVRGGDTLYYDPTVPGMDPGVLLPEERNSYALWLKEGSSLIRLPGDLKDVPVTRSLAGVLSPDGSFTGTLTLGYRYVGMAMAVHFPDRKAMEKEIRNKLRDNYVIDFRSVSTDEAQRTLVAELTLRNYARAAGGNLYCTPYPFMAERDSVLSGLPGGYFVDSMRPVNTAVTLQVPDGVSLPPDTTSTAKHSMGETLFAAHAEGNTLNLSWSSGFSDWQYPPESKPHLDSLLHAMNRQQAIVVRLRGLK